MSICRHKKTGKLYVAVALVTNCTNAQDGQRMVLYRERGELDGPRKWFAREMGEFLEKFEPVSVPDDIDDNQVHLWADN